MKLGIDIDGTIAKTNERLIEEAIVFDKKKVHGRGIKDRSAYSLKDMFFWDIYNVNDFFDYIRNSKFFLTIEPMPQAVEIINKLYEEGYEIIFITRRQDNSKTIRMTKKWLKKNGFKYQKLITGSVKKYETCTTEKIDFFIDDDEKNVQAVLDEGIDAALIDGPYNKENKKLNRLMNWNEIYSYLKNKRG